MRGWIRIFINIALALALSYCLWGLWIKGSIIEKRARFLDECLDQSFFRLGLRPDDLARHFYEERRQGLKKFVHVTKIFDLPDGISPEGFYGAVLEAVKASHAQLLEKTNFEIEGRSASIFILGRRSIATHLIIGIKKKITPRVMEKKDKVAIIIDDLGYNRDALKYIRQIKEPLTLAVLPKLSFSREIAEKGQALGHEIILHLPLEPEKETEYLGPGAVMVNMGDKEIEAIINEDLKTVPYARGVNNHTGSRFTADSEKMKIVLQVLKNKNLFFVDSLVTPHSLGAKLGRELGLHVAERDVFLDNDREEEKIVNQFKELVRISHKKGKAIGIAHPSAVTLKTLEKNLSLFNTVELVHVSALVR